MKKFLSPLWYFVGGMIVLALLTLFYPAIHTQTQQTETQIGTEVESHYWGLHWALSSTRLILFLIIFMLVIFTVGVVWIRRKWGKYNQ